MPENRKVEDDPYAGGVDAPVVPPRAKVRLPENAKKLRKKTRGAERER
jgi:hypothetical protein